MNTTEEALNTYFNAIWKSMTVGKTLCGHLYAIPIRDTLVRSFMAYKTCVPCVSHEPFGRSIASLYPQEVPMLKK